MGAPSDGLVLDEWYTVLGLEATSGHQANCDPEEKCCSGLRAWRNTDHCVMNDMKTSVCNFSGQPAALADEGLLEVGG